MARIIGHARITRLDPTGRFMNPGCAHHGRPLVPAANIKIF